MSPSTTASSSSTDGSSNTHSSRPPLSKLASILKTKTHDNLFKILSRIFTSNNFLILDQNLSNLINYLTPFSKLKQEGKIDKIYWFHLVPNVKNELIELISSYKSIILILEPSHETLNKLKDIITNFSGEKNLKLTIIFPNLSKNYVIELNNELSISSVNASFNRVIESNINKNNYSITLNPMIKIVNWIVEPYDIEEGIISIDLPYGGLQSYFNQPLEQISKLSELFIKILENSTSKQHQFIKLKNIFGKGDHSKLLIKLIQNEYLPQFLNEKLTTLEQEFYQDKLSGNTDLIVLERNLDFFPLLLNQLNYQGLIDDLFGINDELNKSVTLGDSKISLNDELFENLKDLNFASIGSKLNKLAKLIQFEYQQKDNLNDLGEIRKLVNSLGSLTNKQELIKKHTLISESILNFIKINENNTNGKFDQYEFYLQFQNDLFDLDYKQQVNFLIRFLDENLDLHIIISSIILISLINDGIKEKDFDLIQLECLQNHGIEVTLTIDKLIEYNLIIILPSNNNDFLGSLTGLSIGGNNNTTKNQNKIVPSELSSSSKEDLISYDNLDKLGISGSGQYIYKNNYTLINKFWNLHPLIDEYDEIPQQKSTNGADPDNNLINEYPHPSFTLPSNTVPLICRLVESLYFRDFLKYKPVNNIQRRSNWDNLGLDNMFNGKTIDINLCDKLNDKTLKQASKINDPEYCIIILIGGITRSEITIFKYLQQKLIKNGINKEILVLTSGIVNNEKFISFMNENL